MSGEMLLTAVVPMAHMSGRLQNFNNWIGECSKYSIELIIVEDGSDQSTLDEVFAILDKNPALKYTVISGEFGSAGKARNAGINQATGRWICFWDSDDEVLVANFIKMVELAEVNDLDAIVGSFEIVSELDGTITKPLGHDLNSLQTVARMPGLWRMAFRREKIGQTIFQEFKVAEDHHFLVDINFEGMQFRYFNSIVYKYYSGGQGHVTQNSNALEDLYSAAARMHHNFLNQQGGHNLPPSFLLREAVSTLKYSSQESKKAILKSAISFLWKTNMCTKVRVIKALTTTASFEIKLRITHDRKPSTTAILVGGLGNQLFQSVAAVAIAGPGSVRLETNFLSLQSKKIDPNEIARFSFPPNTTLISTRKWERLTKRVVSYCLRVSVSESGFEKSGLWKLIVRTIGCAYFSMYYRKFSFLQLGNGVGYSDFRKTRFNQILIGYFQSYYWHDQLAFSIPEYEVSLKFEAITVKEYSDLASVEKPLIIHLRFGDYLSEPTLGALPVTFYLRAYKHLMLDKQFEKIWVFSDDIEMAKNFLPIEMHSHIRWIGDIDKFAGTSLEIMRFGVAYIISNSTFGWWGAKLSLSERPNIFAPSPWFRARTSPLGILPPTWNVLPAWDQ